jgi:hypothetical protein
MSTEDTMKAATTALIFFVIVFPGCLTMHVDSMARLTIRGEVFSKASGKPLEKVNIAFVDTGLDSVRSKTGVPKTIGETDAAGRLDLMFDYWWGTDKGLFKKKPSMTFAIELSLEHYKSERFKFVLSDLPSEEGTYRIFLGKVYLEAKQ